MSLSPTVDLNSLDILNLRFPGAISIPLPSVAQVLGIKEQTLRNLVSQGKCPVPTFRQGKFRYAHVLDLAAHLDRMREKAHQGGA